MADIIRSAIYLNRINFSPDLTNFVSQQTNIAKLANFARD